MPMSELSPVPRQEVARLFVESWKEDLRPLCKHMERWVHALAPALVPERVYVAVRDGEVLGMAVCSAGAHRALHVTCLLYTSPSPRDGATSRMPSSA